MLHLDAFFLKKLLAEKQRVPSSQKWKKEALDDCPCSD